MTLSLSIIIPTRNEAKFIDRCLESILKMDPVPGGREVLVVDGLSNDGTDRILKSWSRKLPNLRVLQNPGRIVPTAMNIGIREAKGKLIARLDAHSEYPPDYLRLCVETLCQTGADNVGGAVSAPSVACATLGEKLVQVLTTHSFGVGNAAFRTGAKEGWVDTVPFGCYKREVFERIGLYDERLVRNQDYEFNRRLIRAGGRIRFNPKIRVFYHNQSNLNGLLRQAFVTGQWVPWMWYAAPYSFARRHAVPLLFVCYLVGAFLLSLILPTLGTVAVVSILVPYLALAIRAAFHQARRYGKWLFPLLPFLFFIYHVTYGLGALWGSLLIVLGQSPVQRVPRD